MLGMGTVGSAIAARLLSEWQLLGERSGAVPVLRHVAVRDVQRQRDVTLPETVRLGDDPFAVVDDPAVRVVVEVMGGLQPATECIERALSEGKHVVTANKAVIATHGPRLARLAAAHGAGLWFEASAGAGLPIIALLRDSLLGDRITSLDAVINTTTNVILTHMRRDGVRLADALVDAQRRGFAEADPSSDVDGWDAAYKLVVMSWLAFGVHVPPEDVDRQGIGDVKLDDIGYAGRLDCSVRLLAHAARSDAGVVLSVQPTLVAQSHPLYDIDDSDNAVLIRSDFASSVLVRGRGGGGAPTASAVVSDVVRAARGDIPVYPATDGPARLAGEENDEICGYVRMMLADVDDARGLVLQAFEDRGVPVEDSRDAPSPQHGAQLVVLTGAAPRAVHSRALETVETLAAVRGIAASLDRVC